MRSPEEAGRSKRQSPAPSRGDADLIAKTGHADEMLGRRIDVTGRDELALLLLGLFADIERIVGGSGIATPCSSQGQAMTATLAVRMPADGGVSRHTNAQRQQRKRARLEAAGLVQCNLWVPVSAVAELRLLAAILRAHPHLLPGPLRDPVSGKLVSARSIGGPRC